MRSSDIEKQVSNFKPSKIVLPRILKALLENGSIGRTTLATAFNTDYPIVARHLIWLEMKSFVEFLIENDKLMIKLTAKGREFALKTIRFHTDLEYEL